MTRRRSTSRLTLVHLPRLARLVFSALQARVIAQREPDFVVGADDPDGAYLERWYLTPWRRLQTRLRNRAEANPVWLNRATARLGNCLPNLYLHRFLRDDDDRALHDHPSWSASLILLGMYGEHTIAAGGVHHREIYRTGDLRLLPTRHAHRIELGPFADECWTLFLMGPTVREWGFHCPQRGWVHWRKFTAPGKPGDVGKGCDA